jgi:hypothetical protein
MKYFITLNDDNRVTGVYSEDYKPEGQVYIEVPEETAKLPSTSLHLEDWLFYNNTLQFDPLLVLTQVTTFVQGRKE